MRKLLLSAALAVSFAPALVFADDAQGEKVEVVAEVVHAHNASAELIPPEMAKLKGELERQKGVPRFTGFKRLEEKKLELFLGKPVELKLVDARTARVTLLGIKEDVADVELQVPELKSKTRFSLGKKGSVIQNAGMHDRGVLILRFSPTEAAKK